MSLSPSLVTSLARFPCSTTCKPPSPYESFCEKNFDINENIYRIDHQDATNVDEKGIAFTIRSVFFIDPKKKIRTILSYPASTGRNAAEVLRIVDSLQTGDKYRVTTPIDWQPGQDVIVAPVIKDDEAKKLFPNYKTIKPYLRMTSLPEVS